LRAGVEFGTWMANQWAGTGMWCRTDSLHGEVGLHLEISLKYPTNDDSDAAVTVVIPQYFMRVEQF
jgi:hypothetical protein